MEEKIRVLKVENLNGRVETGPLQFNDDWPGIFIRGDNALYYSFLLNQLIAKFEKEKESALNFIELAELYNLKKLFASCNAHIKNGDKK